MPTVREPDGLAMSSRNTYLTDSDREVALACPGRCGPAPARRRGAEAVRRAARAVLVRRAAGAGRLPRAGAPARTSLDVPEWYRGEALLAVAARVGTTRLIDNLPIRLGPGGGALEVFSRARRRSGRAGLSAAGGRGSSASLSPGLAGSSRPSPAGRRAPTSSWSGSGIAGLTTALRLRQRVDRVLLVTKTVLDEGSTQWAQGGIAAALDPADSPEEHLHDTLVAGVRGLRRRGRHGAGHRGARAGCASSSRSAPSSTSTRTGEIKLTREGGHHRDRIAHAGGDATGKEISRALIAALDAVRDDPGIEVIEHALVVDLLQDADRPRLRRHAARHRRGPVRRRRRGHARGPSSWPPAGSGRSTPRPPTPRWPPATAWPRRCGPGP